MIEIERPIEARVDAFSIYLFDIWMTRKGLSHAESNHLKRPSGVAAGGIALHYASVGCAVRVRAVGSAGTTETMGQKRQASRISSIAERQMPCERPRVVLQKATPVSPSAS